MALRTPRNAESLDHAHSLNHANGNLVWASSSPGGDIEDAIGPLREEEIVFALRRREGDGYLVYSLAEPQQPGEAAAQPGEAAAAQPKAGAAGPPFRLSALLAPTLPEGLLAKHLLTRVPDHLVCDAGHRLHVVVSTGSGTCQARDFHDAVLRPLLAALGLVAGSEDADAARREGGYELTITQSPQTVRDLARRLWGSESGPPVARTIVLLSGDGGVVDLLNGSSSSSSGEPTRAGPQPSIALLPLGTGNALFHSLHKPLYAAAGDGGGPSPYVLGLRTLLAGAAAPLPTFRASFSPGSRLVTYSEEEGRPAQDQEQDQAALENQRRDKPVDHLVGAIVASYGFHASLVWESDTPEHRRHGAARFGMAARELLATNHAYRAVVEVRPPAGVGGSGGVRRLGRESYGYVLGAMVSNLERTFTISPASAPLGGQLRLVHFGDVGADGMMDIMQSAYDGGSHVGISWVTKDGVEDGVGYDEVEGFKVTVEEDDPRWRKVCVDGVIVELAPGGWMAVEKIPESRFDVVVDRSLLKGA